MMRLPRGQVGNARGAGAGGHPTDAEADVKLVSLPRDVRKRSEGDGRCLETIETRNSDYRYRDFTYPQLDGCVESVEH